MKLALIQGRVRADRPSENMENIKAALKRKEIQGADLVVFPPLVLSGRLSEAVLRRPGVDLQYKKVWEDFTRLSAEYPDTALASSMLTWTEGQIREAVFVLRGGEVILGAEIDQSGEVPMCPINGLNLSLWSGPGLSDCAAGSCDILLTLHSHVYNGQAFAPPKSGPAKAWRINVGAIGAEGPHIFEGSTYVIDPSGCLKGWAYGFDSATVLMDTNSHKLPDAEVPAREPVEILYQALKTGLHDFILGNGSGKVLIGLSGGLDSALVAALAVDALGPENVLGVAMPSENNSPESLSLARALAVNLGISFLTIPITAINESFTRSFLLAPKTDVVEGNLADENIQARIRGVLLMYIANREGRLLLATGNKSEAAMGYCTLYGDTCGSIAPIGDVYKTRVYELARHVNRDGERIPEGIITRPPSAELRPDQKDEDSLPPYEILDDILRLYLEERLSGSKVAIVGRHSPMTVAWALSTLKKTAFKRQQSPFALVASSCPLSMV